MTVLVVGGRLSLTLQLALQRLGMEVVTAGHALTTAVEAIRWPATATFGGEYLRDFDPPPRFDLDDEPRHFNLPVMPWFAYAPPAARPVPLRRRAYRTQARG